jgi:hypothetical protein
METTDAHQRSPPKGENDIVGGDELFGEFLKEGIAEQSREGALAPSEHLGLEGDPGKNHTSQRDAHEATEAAEKELCIMPERLPSAARWRQSSRKNSNPTAMKPVQRDRA